MEQSQNIEQNTAKKWFMDFPYTKFRKTLTRYHEIDSLPTLCDRAGEFMGRTGLENELPETLEESHALGELLYYFQLYEESEIWLKKAAEGGHAQAQNDYGELILHTRDNEAADFNVEALRWFERSMDQGNVDGLTSAFRLYRRYYFLTEMNPGFIKAYDESVVRELGCALRRVMETQKKCLELAESGNVKAAKCLGRCSSIEKRMEGLAEAGDPDAMGLLAEYYAEDAANGKRDFKDAADMAIRSADLGCFESMLAASRAYRMGLGVERSPEKAFSYALKAAQKDWRASRLVAKMYYNGDGVERSYTEARRWFMVVCEDTESQYYLGELYALGQGVEKSYETAAEWYKLSANCVDGDVDKFLEEYYGPCESYSRARVKLACMYATGSSVEKDARAARVLMCNLSNGSESSLNITRTQSDLV